MYFVVYFLSGPLNKVYYMKYLLSLLLYILYMYSTMQAGLRVRACRACACRAGAC